MQNMKLCNTLAYAGFDPKAEAKKQARGSRNPVAHPDALKPCALAIACGGALHGNGIIARAMVLNPFVPRSARSIDSSGAATVARVGIGARSVQRQAPRVRACAEQPMPHLVPAAVRLSATVPSSRTTYAFQIRKEKKDPMAAALLWFCAKRPPHSPIGRPTRIVRSLCCAERRKTRVPRPSRPPTVHGKALIRLGPEPTAPPLAARMQS